MEHLFKKYTYCTIIFLSITMIFSLSVLEAQPFDSAMYVRLEGKTRLSDIMKEVKAYLNPRIKTTNSSDKYFKQLKYWHRWALYMSNRLSGAGDITDVNKRTNDVFKQISSNTNRIEDINSSYGSWSFLGPTSVNSSDLRLGIGRCDRITFHPTDPNTIYIGTPAGGLWRSTNDGASWISLTTNLPTIGISGIVVDYSNSSILYILTGDGDSNMGGFVQNFDYMRTSTGVYKSIDGGSTWTQTGELSNSPYTGYKLVQDPDESNTLLAATSLGIYRTTDGGSSWTLVTASVKFYDIEYDPNDPDRVYASRNGQVLYSTNSGLSWLTATFDVSIGSAGRVELAVSPNNSSYVYALTGGVSVAGMFTGLYRSTNNGVSYTQRCNTPNIMDGSQAGDGNGSQASYDLALTAAPFNANRVLTGGVNVWSSIDGGTSMSAIMFDGSGNRKIHVDIHDLKYNPLNNALYCANDGGLFKSLDNGITWDKLSDGIDVSQIYHLAGADADVNVLSSGLQDNGINSRTTLTSSFNHNATGDGFDVAVKHDDVTNGYGVINKKVYSMNLNGGASNEFAPVDQWYPTLAVNPTNSSTVYCGYVDVYKSTNGAVDWINKGGNGSWCMTTCPSNSNRIYAAGGVNEYNDDPNGILSRSDNGGDSWTTVFNSGDATYNKITSVAVDPSNSNNVWITLGGYNDGLKVFRSTNAGGGWINVSGSLPNLPVNCVTVDGNNNAYVGTDLGVYYRGNSQTDWTPFYTNLPRVPVTDLVINEGSGVIRAATFGRGIYTANLYSTCIPSLVLNSTYIGNDFYEASSTITSAGSISGGAGTQIFFKAGGSITLSDGFDATAGNEFMAYLGNCGNDVPSMRSGSGSTEFTTPPSPALLPFITLGQIEITEVNAVNCDVKITRKTDNADMRIVLFDDEGNLLKNERINAENNKPEFIYRIGYHFLAGHLYKALFYVENNLVHWQEIFYD